MESDIKKSIKVYRDRNYSNIVSEAKDGVLDLFLNDDEKPDKAAKKTDI